MSEIEVPTNWKQENFSNIVSVLESGKRPTGGAKGICEGIPSLGGEHLNYNGHFNFHSVKFVPTDFFKKMKRGIIQKNDILIVKDGATTGKTSFVDEKFPYEHACVNEHVFIIRPTDAILPKFLYYFLRSTNAQKYISNKIKGDIGGINTTFINNFKIVYPTNKKTQEKIINKLDYLFKYLEETKKTIYELNQMDMLKNYEIKIKREFLSKLFLGVFTKNWREKNSSIETSDVFLKFIFNERKKIYEKNVQDSNKNQQKKPKTLDNFKENISFNDLPEIPPSWKWCSLNSVCSKITDGEHLNPHYCETGHLLLSAKNIREDIVSFDKVNYISQKDFEYAYSRCNPEKNDTLIVSVGATTGRTAFLTVDTKFAVLRSVLLLKPEFIMPQYLFRYLQSSFAFNLMVNASGASAQPHLYIRDLKKLPFPLAPLTEQREIVKIGESKIDELNKSSIIFKNIIKNKQKTLCYLDYQEFSILDHAFSGKLVN